MDSRVIVLLRGMCYNGSIKKTGGIILKDLTLSFGKPVCVGLYTVFALIAAKKKSPCRC